ncbi:MAG: superoxide dismutase [Phycisphaerae bacterium]|nr:MAG: superoxide dismutase [Phycisphaerae bacterium]
MFKIPELPYANTALEPHISRQTMDLHHGKHHRGYVENLNKLVADTKYADMTLEEVVLNSSRNPADAAIFNNAAQAWNHAFLWKSMSPDGGSDPGDDLKDAIVEDFGSLETFISQFRKAATGQFGSGWVWLVRDAAKLKIVTTGNAGTPITDTTVPLLTLDVWEHAYYLDYQNERGRYVDVFLKELINWDFAVSNIETSSNAA